MLRHRRRDPDPRTWYAGPAWKRYRTALRERLSHPRIRHCRRTGETARRLAEAWGQDEVRACLAGYLHDIAREMPRREMLLRAGYPAYPENRDPGAAPGRGLLHGPAGAHLLREMGLEDEAVLEAVRLHTAGGPGMGAVAKAVYVADYIEPGRPESSASEVEGWLALGMDRAVLRVLQRSLGHLRDQGKDPAPQSLALLEELQGKAGRL